MKGSFIIAGTDTNIGKTVLSALYMSVREDLSYWKPIQSGLEGETDSIVVRRISECKPERVLPEAYRLSRPLSPHLSARLDGVEIDPKQLLLPKQSGLIIETAGGVLVPINENLLQIDLMKTWALPVVIAARSSLGTINHSLLTIEALRKRDISIAGLVMIGEVNEENEKAVGYYGGIEIIGRIPPVPIMNKESLVAIYHEYFRTLTF
ncbi:MAG: dethiobiotin synthase [Bacteroidota bacterium]|nr:dethiobiotin synthase [Bacteroidota bacterium]MDP4231632.1 dethiobiotin synthase [Bacteroidota bacterium]MDP4236425.1 dethiobiotin synthase [Bacteroidota bacterium]